MSEENGLITHNSATPHEEDLRATQDKTTGITSPEVILGILVGN